jgi:hypothetical protein
MAGGEWTPDLAPTRDDAELVPAATAGDSGASTSTSSSTSTSTSATVLGLALAEATCAWASA